MLMILFISGCISSKAKYVRNPEHNCVKMAGAFSQNEIMVDSEGKEIISYGWQTWHCKNNVTVIIDNDEERP